MINSFLFYFLFSFCFNKRYFIIFTFILQPLSIFSKQIYSTDSIWINCLFFSEIKKQRVEWIVYYDRIIYNEIYRIYNTDVYQCSERCRNTNGECFSLTYHPNTRQCLFNRATQLTHVNSAGWYFRREVTFG